MLIFGFFHSSQNLETNTVLNVYNNNNNQKCLLIINQHIILISEDRVTLKTAENTALITEINYSLTQSLRKQLF